jgi:anti-sigma factor RsiW
VREQAAAFEPAQSDGAVLRIKHAFQNRLRPDDNRGVQEKCDRTAHAAAYVLGELGSHELDDFARHLQTCDICVEEVELLESAADAVPLLASRPLGVAGPDEPPVVDRSTRPFRTDPLHPHGNGDLPAEVIPVRSRPRLRAIRGGADKTEEQDHSRFADRTGLRYRTIARPARASLAALIIVALVTIIVTRKAGAVTYVTAKAGWTAGGARVKIQGSQAELLVEGMPQPAAGKTYKIWVLEKGASQIAPTGATIRLNSAGEAGVNVPGNIDDAIALAVYVEPIDGRQTTASGAVVVADLRSVTEPSS